MGRIEKMNWRIKSLAFVFAVFLVSQVFLVSTVEAETDSWTDKASMLTGRRGCGSVAVSSGMIYVIGGVDADSVALSVNEMYNPTSNTWVAKASMPTPRANFGIVTYGNNIYVIGGGGVFGADGVTGVNEVYNTQTDTWETKTPMPTAREYLCANVVDGKIYLMGGNKPVNRDSPIYVSNVNEVYDIATDTWSSKTSPPMLVSSYASAVVGDKIYLISGIGDSGELTLIYDTKTDSWSNGAPIPQSVWGAAAGVTSGKQAPVRIYVIGGYPAFDLVQIYDPKTDSWAEGANMPTPRYRVSVSVVDDCLYVFGGPGNEGMIANEMYTPLDHDDVAALSMKGNTLVIFVIVVVIIAVIGAVMLVLKLKGKSNRQI